VVDYVVKIIERDLLPKYPNVDGVVGLNHLYGCGVAINAPAAVVPIRTIHNIALNPNFGGEVMVIGLGCEKLQPERLLQGTEDVKSIPVDSASIVSLQDEKHVGFKSMVDDILQVAERHLAKLNQRQRETCPASELVVGYAVRRQRRLLRRDRQPGGGLRVRSAGALRRDGDVLGGDRSPRRHPSADAAGDQRRGG
jgi:galactarate dehydratase